MRSSSRVAPRAGVEGPGSPAGALATLLRDLGPRLRRGAAPPDDPARDATGLPDLDRLLRGGVPRGRLVEISGPPSSGRTSLALGWLARVTRAGEVAAVVDAADALDPVSAEAAGVVLPRILWVRAPGPPEALRAAERLLTTRGFALVLLDLDADPGDERTAATPNAAWLRLSRAAAGSRTSLALLAARRLAGTFSDLALELQPAGARFSPAPALLEGIESRSVLVRNRLGPPGQESCWMRSA